MYTVRFWNKANECVKVGGKYNHDFDSYDDAMDAANALVKSAYKIGAVQMDINNDFYPIISD